MTTWCTRWRTSLRMLNNVPRNGMRRRWNGSCAKSNVSVNARPDSWNNSARKRCEPVPTRGSGRPLKRRVHLTIAAPLGPPVLPLLDRHGPISDPYPTVRKRPNRSGMDVRIQDRLLSRVLVQNELPQVLRGKRRSTIPCQHRRPRNPQPAMPSSPNAARQMQRMWNGQQLQVVPFRIGL